MASLTAINPNPSSLESSPPPPSSLPLSSGESQAPSSSAFSFKRPSIRVTSEFDSDSSSFLNKVSFKVLDSLAKFKLSFQSNTNGETFDPRIGFISKYLSLEYDVEEQNALVKSSFDLGKGLHFRATHDLKAKEGEVAMVASFADPSYKLELCSPFPSVGMPTATAKFPLGEVSLSENENEDAKKVLSVSGIVKGQLLNGICTAQYSDEDLNLRYSYKDEEVTFIPVISLPSHALSFAFKRRFSPSDKLSYLYNFDSNYWSTVYKHTVGKDLKLKAGYDSNVRVGWASLWVGNEEGTAKTAPMKMKMQFMLQVPQDAVNSPVFMFKIKKRWDV